MSDVLWHLAGPRLQLQRIADAVREGRSVIVLSAQPGFPTRLSDDIARGLFALDLTTTQIRSTNGQSPLAELMVGMGQTAHRAASLRDAFEGCAGRVFFIGGCDQAKGREWHDFIVKFQHSSRQLPPDQRACIVLLREVIPGEVAPNDDVAMSCFQWDSAITRADIEAFAQGFIDRGVVSRTLRRILARTVAEVALSDLNLARDLCGQSRADLAMPHDAICRWGAANGWSREVLPPDLWIEGIRHAHPLARALQPDGRRQIWRLVWQAQAAVLLPWVEDHRLRYLAEVTCCLPESSSDGQLRDEFSAGTIAYFLRIRRPRHRHLPLFERLASVRNKMAHCEPLPYDRLYADISYVESFR